MEKNWIVRNFSPQAFALSKKYNINPVLAQLLINRDIREEEFFSFLEPRVDNLFSPFLLPDIDKALERIRKAIERRERVCLLGDYDVDGVTSLVIFYEYIKNFPLQISFYIPHRIHEGYGLTKNVLEKVKGDGVTLLICFDCGTNSYQEARLAKSLGIDIIVVDHHTPKEGLNNDFYAFLNPKREGSSYPFKELTSAGLAFKVVWALRRNFPFDLLDLVALATVCDVVPLKGENRIFLSEGIKWLRSSHRPAISALCESAKITPKNIEPYHIGYILGPRINACGRVADAKKILDFLLCYDTEQLRESAKIIEDYNRQRKAIESEVLRDAEEIVERELKEDFALVVYRDGWHPGVLGIVASKLAERFWRPTLVIGIEGNKGKGSGRSIPGIHIMEVLEECKELLSTYGGHKKAAGIEILKENLEKFKYKFNETVERRVGSKRSLPNLEIDLELPFRYISVKLAQELEKLKPFGEENSYPLFLTRKVHVKSPPKKVNISSGKQTKLYNFWITDGTYTYEAVSSEDNQFLDLLNYGASLDIVYSLERNSYYGNVRLVIRDIRIS
ncbi:MAG: single-stranded-DNA-specific exonuclease RecJ [Candidatus Omnitrophica bacterium]|nr:single-stranded-DNA-specific exonuclease RecJ [Candidatus Omnitrophota bacterium]